MDSKKIGHDKNPFLFALSVLHNNRSEQLTHSFVTICSSSEFDSKTLRIQLAIHGYCLFYSLRVHSLPHHPESRRQSILECKGRLALCSHSSLVLFVPSWRYMMDDSGSSSLSRKTLKIAKLQKVQDYLFLFLTYFECMASSWPNATNTNGCLPYTHATVDAEDASYLASFEIFQAVCSILRDRC